MSEAFSLMLWPLLASFVLVGIHAYLGIHVIARKVIFVDLALAQIAALGAVYGVFIGFSLANDYLTIKAISVVFTLLGALVFSYTKTHEEIIPHEAIIGIIYAAALSLTIILAGNLAHGREEVSQLLSGNILWVTKNEVIGTAFLYVIIGLVHYVFRHHFFSLSFAKNHEPSYPSRKWWDFLFYATFGVVVTSSVGIGGVLLVFAYLVIPSVIGVLLATSLKARLAIAWSSGLLMSFLGVVLSYFLDLPSGPTIVVLLAVLLLSIALMSQLKNKSSRIRGWYQVIFIAFILVLLTTIPRLNRIETGHEHDHQEMHHKAEPVMPSLELLSSPSEKDRVSAIEQLKDIGGEKAHALLLQRAQEERDPFIIIDIALALIDFMDKQGLFLLEKIMLSNYSEFATDDAYLHLKASFVGAPETKEELLRWLKENRENIHPSAEHKKFVITPKN